MKWSAAARRTTLVLGWCALVLCFMSANAAMGQPGLLSSSDTAIGIDLDSIFVGPQNNGRYPGAESPPKAIDGVLGSKYLNFGAAGSGFIVTPSFPAAVESFQITTGNDAPGRDPASWALYGFNGALTTTDSGPSPAINQTGLAEAWTLIDSGLVALPGDPTMGGDQRGVLGPVVNVNSGGNAWEHYKMIFPTIKRPSDNIMQFDEIQFFLDDFATPAQALLTPSDPIIAVDETPTPAGWKACGTPNTDCSSSPGGEQPPLAIDQVFNAGPPISTTKYLNFGEQNSGIIITNSEGPVDVNFMRFRTANDAPARDPASWKLYGTNDPITSEPNSNSNGTETWTLIAESDSLTLPMDRHTWGSFIAVNSPANYTSYRLIFPTVRDEAGANSMQIADIQFYTVIPEPSTMALVAIMGLAIAAAGRRRVG